ncbi:FAD-binding protein [Kytococcus schroeteri]|nr:FAD-binding protein [Kytococcus schroeteri]
MSPASSSFRPTSSRAPGAGATPPADAVVVGHGLAGLVCASELLAAGRTVTLVDASPETDLGGQAWWSFGGLFLVDSPQQRRLRVKDSLELAWADWERTAGWDRAEDALGRQWARAYVEWAHRGKREWLATKGIRFFPVVGWAERGDNRGPGVENTGPGNSVPRFHITWGTGPGLVQPFVDDLRRGIEAGRATYLPGHRVVELLREGDRVVGVRAEVLEADGGPVGGRDAAATAPGPGSASGTTSGTRATLPTGERGRARATRVTGETELRGGAVVLATGGIGGNDAMMRGAWPQRLGALPEDLLHGVPAYVDGSGLELGAQAGAAWVNTDRMWAYTEGLGNPEAVWHRHGIRILPGPSSLWLDADGHRLPAPLFPGTDTLGTLEHLQATGAEHSWFVTNRRIVGKEFALSGSEQNPDLTGRSVRGVLGRVRTDVPAPVQAFVDAGDDVIEADDLETLLGRMEAMGGRPLDRAAVREAVAAHGREDDPQRRLLRDARTYLGDKLVRSVAPHDLQDPAAGPLMAVRLRILSRKTLGGLATRLDGAVLDAAGGPVPGLFAAGEVSGFGGGGVHGYRSLEGTFLGGCLFTGRRAAAGVIAG